MPDQASQPGGPSFSLFKMIDDLKRSSSERDQGRAEGMEKILRDQQTIQHEAALNKAMQREAPSRVAQAGVQDGADIATLQKFRGAGAAPQASPLPPDLMQMLAGLIGGGAPPPQPGLPLPGGGGGLPLGAGGGLPPGGPGLSPGGPGGIPPQLAALLQLSQGIA